MTFVYWYLSGLISVFGLVAVVIWIFEQPFWRKPIFKEKK